MKVRKSQRLRSESISETPRGKHSALTSMLMACTLVRVLVLGGEHLVTLGSVRAAVKRFPDLQILHFDAHADLREDYLGNPLSHACVLRRCYDLLGDGRIHQFGIRSGTREEFAFMAAGHVITERHTCATLKRLTFPADVPVYLTVDMDVLDPSEFPGTGTQEAGGLRFRELLEALLDIFARFNIVAFDNVELAPSLDPSGRSTALACKLLREELLGMETGMKTGGTDLRP